MPHVQFTFYPPGQPDRAQLGKIPDVYNVTQAMILAVADVRFRGMIKKDFRLAFDTQAEEIEHAMREGLPVRARKAIINTICGRNVYYTGRGRDGLTRAALALVTVDTLMLLPNCGRKTAAAAVKWIAQYLAANPPSPPRVEVDVAAVINRKMALAVDTKKQFVRNKDTGRWHWHDSGDPEPRGESFPTFLAALDDAVQPYWDEEQDPEDRRAGADDDEEICDECGALIPDDAPDVINAHHEESCSCHPQNTV